MKLAGAVEYCFGFTDGWREDAVNEGFPLISEGDVSVWINCGINLKFELGKKTHKMYTNGYYKIYD